ncbi:formyltetrahydrofolate deformylase [Thalassotalea sp. HSM 43]|uniref:formyltetrahydrofolate deformylase n=1 Tax=Thalassotalea sp. HSM 43 TaxID=2552945 RepID=UPI001080DDF5|nr:formyltetrahydrofolate deformylase [Thalassotalea sp. HSM 43]QBY03670.1 formyltetrahydrofolate deformylase [Thalassotalea sp. HSM 43]
MLTLVISCPDTIGIVAKVSHFIASNNGSVMESNHHTDIEERWFYMRNVINTSKMNISQAQFEQQFAAIAEEFSMQWHVRDMNEKQKVVLFASHTSHCLADILHRWHSGELDCDIAAVISNHQNLESLVRFYQIPFHHITMTADTKADAFANIDKLLNEYQADTIVLARFMQIIPEAMCHKYHGRLINIHHSFLPSFIGANPYQKAHDRGVKLIGATCHYVTADLDEGPIIEQEVIRVNHSCDKHDLIRLGKDVEQMALARGLRYHLQDRVIIRGNKTIVF